MRGQARTLAQDRLEQRFSTAQRIAGPAGGEGFRRESDDQLSVRRIKRRGAKQLERLGAGQVADHDPGEQFDHRRDGGAFVPAEGKHGARQGSFGIGRWPAVRIHGPAFRQLLACPAVELDLAARGNRGREVENVGRLLFSRPAKGKRIGAQQRSVATGRSDGGIARAHGQAGQACLCQSFDLHPKGGKMHRIVDRECGNAARPCPLDQHRQTQFEGWVGETMLRIHFDEGGSVLRQQLGQRVRFYLPGLDCP